MPLSKLLKKVQAINLNDLAAEVIRETESEIIDLNTSQLRKGVDSNDSALPDYARTSEDYFQAKKAQGLATAGRRYNLLLTGEFHEGFFLERKSKEEFFIDSKDPKRDRMVALTSDKIFGLTDDNFDKYVNETFLPIFSDKLDTLLGL